MSAGKGLLRIHPKDDMAVALSDLAPGTRVEVDGEWLHTLTRVPAKHKVYVRDLPEGALPRLYGLPVGRTTRPVRRGEAVTRENLADLEASAVIDRQEARWTPPDVNGLPTTFRGYRRPDGQVGTRNHILVAYTVPCVSHIAARAAAIARRAFGLDNDTPWVHYARTGRFPDSEETRSEQRVDDIVVLHHQSGCGMPDHGDRERLIRYLVGYIRHPNVAAALVLGLGCEKVPVTELEQVVGETWKPVIYLEHQRIGTEAALLKASLDALRELVTEARRHRREPVPVSQLTLGVECGGSDGFSGITANPTVGVASDVIVSLGGRVILPEVPEMVGAEPLLTARAANEKVREQIVALIEGFKRYAGGFGARVAENLSWGNIREGLTTIQMKSLGVVQKAGTGPIVGVLDYGEAVGEAGVYLLNTPGFDIPSVSALPLSGAQVVVFTTGLGTPTGNPIVPVIKVASSHETARRMKDIIDFDAGRVLDGAPPLQVGQALYRLIVRVASGEWTANEGWGHRESAFWNVQMML